MDPFLVYHKENLKPAAHALIIGVGDYPHLLQGDGRLSEEWHEGMGQLVSPPLSAGEFASWLIRNFCNQKTPLGSVALLLSGEQAEAFHSPTGETIHVERANLDNVKSAAKAWFDRGNTDEQNMLLFYFCGHGIATGADTSLLLENYAADDEAPLAGALDFRKFHLGLERCAARKQIFFVDACRVASPTVIETCDYGGDPIFHPGRRREPGRPPRLAPVLYATLAGEAAYARAGQISQYTEALLRAFDSAADDDGEDERWRVYPENLNRCINQILKREAEKGADILQVNSADFLTTFTFHELPGEPHVPVVVSCYPEYFHNRAILSSNKESNHEDAEDHGPGSIHGWDLCLGVGSYTFKAKISNGSEREVQKSRVIRPVFRRVEVRIP